MRNLIANALSLVLLWTFIGPAALVAASGRDAHACCHRAHPFNSSTDARLYPPGPSHQCCRLLFPSHPPRVAIAPLTFALRIAYVNTTELPRNREVELWFGSHPERAPPLALS